MTETHDPFSEDARVRALLASCAAPSDQLPPEVAARLDATLADLVAERAGDRRSTNGSANVLPLRRRWPSYAAAAAAVVALGSTAFATGVFTGGAPAPTAADSTSGRTSLSSTPGSESQEAAGTAPSAPSPTQAYSVTPQSTDLRAMAVPLLRVDHLQGDIEAVLRPVSGLTVQGSEMGDQKNARTHAQPSTGTLAQAPTCEAGAGSSPSGPSYAVTFRGAPALLIDEGDTAVVRDCSGTVLARVALPTTTPSPTPTTP